MISKYSVSIIADNKAVNLCIWGIALLSAVIAYIFYIPDNSILHFTIEDNNHYKWLVACINTTAIALSCFMLARINQVHAIMQQRTQLPITLFLVLNCFNPELIANFNSGLILTPIWLLMLYRIYGTYQSEGQYVAFGIGFLSMAGAILFPPFIFSALLFTAGTAYMRSINWRTIAACIIGIVTIAWIIFCACTLTGYSMPYDIRLIDPNSFEIQHENIDYRDIIIFIITTVIALFTAIGGTYFISRHKIRIWLCNRFTVLLTICLILLIVTDIDHINNYLPLLNVTTSIAASNYFLHTVRKRYALWILCAVILTYITLYLWKFWEIWGI